MRPSHNRLPLSGVRRLWGRWMDVIRRCMRPKRINKGISDYEYERLHGELMKQCYLYLQSDELAKRHLFQQLYTVLSPWTTLSALRKANPQLLATLLPQCRELQQSLRALPDRSERFPWRMITACLLLALAGAGIYFAVVHGEQAGAGLWAEWRVSLARSKLTLARLSLLEKFSIVTLVVVLMGLWMNWSVKKS